MSPTRSIRMLARCLPLALIASLPTPAEAFFHANRFGGGTAHFAGVGTTHFNAFGGSATHYSGGGWSKRGMGGGTAYGDAHYGGAYYRPRGYVYPGYHPPVVVGHYGASCYNCGGWGTAAAAATGAAVGAAVAGANDAAAAPSGPAYAVGATYTALPPGAVVATVGGVTYYTANGFWFQPSYGANGVYYRVVPSP